MHDVLRVVLIAMLAAGTTAYAQNSAPSSHMVFNDHFDGDILINEVRVPKDGTAMYTYYETIGWRGLGAGYGGIQVHPRARNFIFSIWDHKKHTAKIKAVHHGPGTETKPFGGEGTGLKSWNFKLGWNTDVWYTFIARAWPVGDHTHYGLWVRAADTRKWTHLITMDVAAKDARFRGGNDAFIEDWSRTGAKPRTTHLRGGWKRKMDGSWFAVTEGRYSVNKWDLVEGKRSYSFRTNWDGGVGKDQTGPYYYMIAGGEKTKPTTQNPSKHTIRRTEKKPGYLRLVIKKLTVTPKGKSLVVAWDLDETTLPQFAYRVQVFADEAGKGKALVLQDAKLAHVRSATLDASALELGRKTYWLHLQWTDILDGVISTKVRLASR